LGPPGPGAARAGGGLFFPSPKTIRKKNNRAGPKTGGRGGGPPWLLGLEAPEKKGKKKKHRGWFPFPHKGAPGRNLHGRPEGPGNFPRGGGLEMKKIWVFRGVFFFGQNGKFNWERTVRWVWAGLSGHGNMGKKRVSRAGAGNFGGEKREGQSRFCPGPYFQPRFFYWGFLENQRGRQHRGKNGVRLGTRIFLQSKGCVPVILGSDGEERGGGGKGRGRKIS